MTRIPFLFWKSKPTYKNVTKELTNLIRWCITLNLKNKIKNKKET